MQRYALVVGPDVPDHPVRRRGGALAHNGGPVTYTFPEPTKQGHTTTIDRYYQLSDHRWCHVRFVRKPDWLSVTFKALTFDNWDGHGPMYNGSWDLSNDPACVDPWISGSVKWDGCCNFDTQPDHTCDRGDFALFAKAMELVWDQCAHMYESAWQCCGYAAGALPPQVRPWEAP